jgi:DNA adenine methylase Dam
MKQQTVSPLFKYIGGKSWLKDELNKTVNAVLKTRPDIDTYIEPFAGGLGAFLGVADSLINNNIKKVILNDINIKLIQFYQNVYTQSNLLIEKYMQVENAYAATVPAIFFTYDKKKDKELIKTSLIPASQFFNQIRNAFNAEQDPIMNSAYLLFLQTHCFNGIYRENSKGGYNTPFNWDARIITEDKTREKINNVLSVFNKFDIEFSTGSYASLDYSLNALYYLDPPYLNEANSLENAYHKDGFGLFEQEDLIDKVKNSCFIYSNHSSDILITMFQSKNINVSVKEIARKNIISASNESRKTDKIEILLYSK